MLDIIQSYLIDTIDNSDLLTVLFSHMSDEDRKKWLNVLMRVYTVSEEDLYDYYVSISKEKQ